MTFARIATLMAGLAAAAAILLAHATWIAPVPAVIEAGKSVTVQIGHGHDFPNSESVISRDALEIGVVAPGGARTRLTPSVSGKTLSATYDVKTAGTYTFTFAQDRGVTSRTPSGIKPGGRDKNPNATQSTKSYRSAVAYSTTRGAKMLETRPAGLKFELVPQRSAGAVTVTLLWNGKPCPGGTVNVYWPGKGEQKAGTTDAGGKFVYNAPPGAKGQFLLSAAHSAKAAPTAGYDTESYSTVLYLTW
jgi:uncharacterized GH25 family protein